MGWQRLTAQLLSPGTGTLYAVHLNGILTAADYTLLVAMGLVASVLSRTLRHDSVYGQHATEGREIDVLR
ncbi:hypothetical protein AABV77_004404 [Enterobacter asburiae]|uniref:hypothetical protein n=1 Tax=Enterobacter asburiae TaxID=61645 RepID=UPI001B8BE82A|nr:hypothetical protein [Enterobacter asburiae]MBS3042368.1 voltage-gated ClC-type chloride channel ClcB [Enterobacter asburiae]